MKPTLWIDPRNLKDALEQGGGGALRYIMVKPEREGDVALYLEQEIHPLSAAIQELLPLLYRDAPNWKKELAEIRDIIFKEKPKYELVGYLEKAEPSKFWPIRKARDCFDDEEIEQFLEPVYKIVK